MNKGGYQIVDLKNWNYGIGSINSRGNSGYIIELVDGTSKPIMFKRLKVAGVEYGDVIVGVEPTATGFICRFYDFIFTADRTHNTTTITKKS